MICYDIFDYIRHSSRRTAKKAKKNKRLDLPQQLDLSEDEDLQPEPPPQQRPHLLYHQRRHRLQQLTPRRRHQRRRQQARHPDGD